MAEVLPSEVTKLADATRSQDPEVGLAAVAALRGLVDVLEALQVDNARTKGWTWKTIAEQLGVTKQAVHQKYASGRLFGRGK
ncbi:RNA polymerase subunit sigma-70 [Actinopolymorpha sp. NPDC004070]|uniref:RNA polymerase subunit sigma-70 n=1 Tax=Actinopolymorpha sp. NPDC004070 TaxID=3154548 RepID=UPI0033BC31E9